eukprot:5420815-Pyramimonas_sp.AAC.1
MPPVSGPTDHRAPPPESELGRPAAGVTKSAKMCDQKCNYSVDFYNAPPPEGPPSAKAPAGHAAHPRHRSQQGRENVPAAGTNRRRGERICPQRAPITEGERDIPAAGTD